MIILVAARHFCAPLMPVRLRPSETLVFSSAFPVCPAALARTLASSCFRPSTRPPCCSTTLSSFSPLAGFPGAGAGVGAISGSSSSTGMSPISKLILGYPKRFGRKIRPLPALLS